MDCAARQTKNMLKCSDVRCSICLGIFIEPVTTPCDHTLCLRCFEQQIDKTSITCPICRKRLSVWCRQAGKISSLVNNNLWKKIQEQFPDKVREKLMGKDESPFQSPVPRSMAKPGEFGADFCAISQQTRDALKTPEERLNEKISETVAKRLQKDLNADPFAALSSSELNRLYKAAIAGTSPISKTQQRQLPGVADDVTAFRKRPNPAKKLTFDDPDLPCSSQETQTAEPSSTEDIIAEQEALLARCEQEKADRALAKRLKRKYDSEENSINRKKGSECEYMLRRRKV